MATTNRKNMDPTDLLDEVLDAVETNDRQLTRLEGLDHCAVGITETGNHNPRICYSKILLAQHYLEENSMEDLGDALYLVEQYIADDWEELENPPVFISYLHEF